MSIGLGAKMGVWMYNTRLKTTKMLCSSALECENLLNKQIFDGDAPPGE